MLHDLFKLKQAFKTYKEKSQVNMLELVADSIKIDGLALRTKYLQEACNVVKRFTASGFSPQSIQLREGQSQTSQHAELTEFEIKALVEVSRRRDRERKERQGELNLRSKQGILSASNKRSASPENNLSGWKVGDAEPAAMQAGQMLVALQQVSKIARKPHWLWRYQRAAVEDKLRNMNSCSAGCGLAGTLCSIVINEMMVAGVAPDSLHMMIMKAVNSTLTLATLVFVYQVFFIIVYPSIFGVICPGILMLNIMLGLSP